MILMVLSHRPFLELVEVDSEPNVLKFTFMHEGCTYEFHHDRRTALNSQAIDSSLMLTFQATTN